MRLEDVHGPAWRYASGAARQGGTHRGCPQQPSRFKFFQRLHPGSYRARALRGMIVTMGGQAKCLHEAGDKDVGGARVKRQPTREMGTAALLSILAAGFDQSPPHPPPSHPPLAPIAPQCDGGCFFISEYVEPADSSQDGFLELYNGCDRRVNLREYALLLCRDGCDSAEGHAGGDGIPSGALPISLSTTDTYINPGSLFSIVYCETIHTSKCANHNLISVASSFFGDLGDGNGA